MAERCNLEADSFTPPILNKKPTYVEIKVAGPKSVGEIK